MTFKYHHQRVLPAVQYNLRQNGNALVVTQTPSKLLINVSCWTNVNYLFHDKSQKLKIVIVISLITDHYRILFCLALKVLILSNFNFKNFHLQNHIIIKSYGAYFNKTCLKYFTSLFLFFNLNLILLILNSPGFCCFSIYINLKA